MSEAREETRPTDDVALDEAMDDESSPRRGRDGERADGGGYYLYGVGRAGAWRGVRTSERDDLLRVRYRDLEALVRPVPYEMPDFARDDIREHHRVVDAASTRREGLLPAPYGIVFRGRRGVIRFLQEQYIPLDEGLALVQGHVELRLHLSAAEPEARQEAGESALHVYSELRRFARSAFPFPHERERVLSAAFLVPQSAWLQFMDRAEELGHRHHELVFDITGPWPPYDFVSITR